MVSQDSDLDPTSSGPVSRRYGCSGSNNDGSRSRASLRNLRCYGVSRAVNRLQCGVERSDPCAQCALRRALGGIGCGAWGGSGSRMNSRRSTVPLRKSGTVSCACGRSNYSNNDWHSRNFRPNRDSCLRSPSVDRRLSDVMRSDPLSSRVVVCPYTWSVPTLWSLVPHTTTE